MRAVPIVEPTVTHAIGFVVPQRELLTPLAAALATEARRLAPALEEGSER